MPLSLSAIAIAEKNKLATNSVFLIFLEVDIPGQDSIFIVRNNENIAWNGHTWIAFPFEVDTIKEAKGQVPQTVLRVSNISLYMQQIVKLYDYYIKTHALQLISVIFYTVNTNSIAANSSCPPEETYTFQVTQPKTDFNWAYFTLSAYNPYGKRFPKDVVLKDGCRYIFKSSDFCRYAGDITSCDRTLYTCRALSNSARIGAFPGVGLGGIVVTSP